MQQSEYELLDFGDARRLERFGPYVLDRACPAAEPFRPQRPGLWREATARFVLESQDVVGERGTWVAASGEPFQPEPWSVGFPPIRLELKCTPFGHLGVFPEQAPNWRRIAELIGEAIAKKTGTEPFRVLNLFAYTGGSTLAAAATGAEVVHLDAAKNLLPWAARNAELSGLHDSKIRWIAEDAVRFVRRELKRGERYDAVILDPPSYGHGRRGEVWRLSKDLPGLLRNSLELIRPEAGFLLLSCHTPKFDEPRLGKLLQTSLGEKRSGRVKTFPLSIPAAAGRSLPAGCGALLTRIKN